VTLGYDEALARAPEEGPRLILFTDEQPTVPPMPDIPPKRGAERRKNRGQGIFHRRPQIRAPNSPPRARDDEAPCGAISSSTDRPVCHGKRLKPEALSVTFAE
jgi:excinuclease ABC subunit A